MGEEQKHEAFPSEIHRQHKWPETLYMCQVYDRGMSLDTTCRLDIKHFVFRPCLLVQW